MGTCHGIWSALFSKKLPKNSFCVQGWGFGNQKSNLFSCCHPHLHYFYFPRSSHMPNHCWLKPYFFPVCLVPHFRFLSTQSSEPILIFVLSCSVSKVFKLFVAVLTRTLSKCHLLICFSSVVVCNLQLTHQTIPWKLWADLWVSAASPS